jgi:hypothetical protein
MQAVEQICTFHALLGQICCMKAAAYGANDTPGKKLGYGRKRQQLHQAFIQTRREQMHPG